MSIRGLRKLDDGEYDALVLAAAGLQRLSRPSGWRRITPDQMVLHRGKGPWESSASPTPHDSMSFSPLDDADSHAATMRNVRCWRSSTPVAPRHRSEGTASNTANFLLWFHRSARVAVKLLVLLSWADNYRDCTWKSKPLKRSCLRRRPNRPSRDCRLNLLLAATLPMPVGRLPPLAANRTRRDSDETFGGIRFSCLWHPRCIGVRRTAGGHTCRPLVAMYGMYIPAEGANAQAKRLEFVANNLANVETPGFKRDVPTFQARFAEAIQQGKDFPGSQSINDVGGGVKLMDVGTDFSAPRSAKPASTDFAVNGDGFFRVQDVNDQEFLTRAGDFEIDSTGRHNYSRRSVFGAR